MATQVNTPAPPPRQSVVERSNAAIAAITPAHRDFFRPFRRLATFVNGTATEALFGMVDGSRKGKWVGVGLGLIVGIATPIGLIAGGFGGLLIGMAAGAALQGGYGLLTGGYRWMGRQMRGERYADDLVERGKVQSAAQGNRRDYREYVRQRRAAYDSVNTAMILERQNEFTRDYNTYWRDHVNAQASRAPEVEVPR